MQIDLFDKEFDPWRWVQSYQDQQNHLQNKIGATSVFVGSMRDFNDDEDVQSMFLEHYPGMTEKSLYNIAKNAMAKWDVLDLNIAHRVGNILPGDPIVCVVVWSIHRKEAYEANRMIMEELKSNAPFWKKEQRKKGDKWVEKNTKGY